MVLENFPGNETLEGRTKCGWKNAKTIVCLVLIDEY